MPDKESKQPRTHHYIPQFQLEYFQLPDKTIQQYDCKEDKYTRPLKGSLAAENKLYTWTDKEGNESVVIETMFSSLEGQIARVFKKIVSSEFQLNNSDRSLISLFAAMQMYRTPQNRDRAKIAFEKMTKKIMKLPALDQKIFDSHIKQASKKYPELKNMTKEDVENMRKMFESEDYDLKVPNEMFLQSMIEGFKEIAGNIHEIGWSFLIAPDESQFINSDDPFVMTRPKKPGDPFWVGPGIRIRGTEITLPLTPKICLLMSPSLSGTSYKHVDQKTVREVNLRTAAHCRRFLYGGNEVLLRSIVKKLSLNKRGVHTPTVHVDGF